MERLDHLYEAVTHARKNHSKMAKILIQQAFPDKSPEPSLPHRYLYLIRAGIHGGVGLSANILKFVLETVMFKI